MFGIDIVSWRTLSCAVPFNDLCSMRWTSRESIWFFKDWKTLYNADATGHKHVPSGYHVSNWMWHHKLNRFDIFNLQLFVTDLLCPVIIWWHFDGSLHLNLQGKVNVGNSASNTSPGIMVCDHSVQPMHMCVSHMKWKVRCHTTCGRADRWHCGANGSAAGGTQEEACMIQGGPQHGAQPCHHTLSSLGPFYTASRRRARGMEAGRWGGLKTF